MGTRGLLGFIIASQRHATYNNNDSVPGGFGQDIVSFILSLKPETYAKIAEELRKVTWDRKTSSGKTDGYNLLSTAARGKVDSNLRVAESVGFLRDTIFCEWAYFVDFEHQRMEVWTLGHMLTELTFDEIIAEGRICVD